MSNLAQDEDIQELFKVVDRIRERVGTAVPLPTDNGEYAVVSDEHSNSYFPTAYRYPDGNWDLGGEAITSEGLRRFLETYRLKLVHHN